MAWHLNPSQTFTDAQLRASWQAVSPPGTAKAAHATSGLSRGWCGLPNPSPGQGTCPPGHLQHPMSQEGQKDHQGQKPPKLLPVHPATIQKARSVKVHQSGDQETEKQLLSQGHQTVKQPSLTLSGCCQLNSSHFNNGKMYVINLSLATLYNAYIPYITHLICIYCTLYHRLHLAILM